MNHRFDETRDHPLSCNWRPIDPVQVLGLPPAKSKAAVVARAQIIAEAFVVGRADPNAWISYSRRRVALLQPIVALVEIPPMIKRRNSINDQWSPRRREMLESPAYRVLSQSAHRAISRIELELCYHGGNDNGQLPVTFDDFVEYGIDRASVAPALREGEALGFFRITARERGGNREYRTPNKFYLTFAYGRHSRAKPPTDEWRKIKTIVEAARREVQMNSEVESGPASRGVTDSPEMAVRSIGFRAGTFAPKDRIGLE
jgi:hypothetical protein